MRSSWLLLVACLVGCSDAVEVGNLAPRVSFVGPHEVVGEGQVATYFGLEDLERDQAQVVVAVCQGSTCSALDLDNAGLDALPASPLGDSETHRVLWSPCNLGGAAFELEFGVVGSPQRLRTPPTNRQALGVTCP
jgi:hypothetical protein